MTLQLGKMTLQLGETTLQFGENDFAAWENDSAAWENDFAAWESNSATREDLWTVSRIREISKITKNQSSDHRSTSKHKVETLHATSPPLRRVV
jgi:hypothetical protein